MQDYVERAAEIIVWTLTNNQKLTVRAIMLAWEWRGAQHKLDRASYQLRACCVSHPLLCVVLLVKHQSLVARLLQGNLLNDTQV